MWTKIKDRLKQPMPKRTVDVGWALTAKNASLIWDDPAVYRRQNEPNKSAKSVQVCPAAIDLDARQIVVKCPIDIHLAFGYDDQKRPVLRPVDGPMSTVRPKHLGSMIAIVNRNEWRHPDRPILQVITPYIFLADEPVWLNQLPAFLDYTDPPLPGTLISGRFPIHVWPRAMMWAFEWHDTKKPLVIARGAPWFYLRFETMDPSRHVRMVPTELTPEVQAYIDSIGGVTNYVNRTFALFDRARQRRPKQLVFPVTRNPG